MMSDEPVYVCVCGHAKDRHARMLVDDRYLDECDECDYCNKFLADLPWPDKKGWWIADRAIGSADHQFVYAIDDSVTGEIRLCMIGLPMSIERGSCFAPSRFTRYLGDNPFKVTP